MPIALTAEMIGATAVVVVPTVGAAVAYLRLYVSRSITAFHLELIQNLNAAYTKKEDCALKHVNLQSWMEKLDQGVANLDRNLTNRLTKLETIADANAGRDYHSRQHTREIED